MRESEAGKNESGKSFRDDETEGSPSGLRGGGEPDLEEETVAKR